MTEECSVLMRTVVCIKMLTVTKTSMKFQEKVGRQSLRLISVTTKHLPPTEEFQTYKRNVNLVL